MVIKGIRRNAKTFAIIVKSPNVIKDDRLLLFTYWSDYDSTSWCLRDYVSRLELRGKNDGQTINQIINDLEPTDVVLINDHVDTKEGVDAWIKYFYDKQFAKLCPRGAWQQICIRSK